MSDMRVIYIYDDDLEVSEKWLVKVSIIKEEKVDKGDGIYIQRSYVLELIQRFAPDAEMVLGFEVSKLPVLYLSEHEQTMLGRMGDLRINAHYKYIIKKDLKARSYDRFLCSL